MPHVNIVSFPHLSLPFSRSCTQGSPKAVVCAPLFTPTGKIPFGVLEVMNTQNHAFTLTEQRMVEMAATLLSQSLWTAELHEIAAREQLKTSRLFTATNVLMGTVNMAAFLSVLAELVRDLSNAGAVECYFVEPEELSAGSSTSSSTSRSRSTGQDESASGRSATGCDIVGRNKTVRKSRFTANEPEGEGAEGQSPDAPRPSSTRPAYMVKCAEAADVTNMATRTGPSTTASAASTHPTASSSRHGKTQLTSRTGRAHRGAAKASSSEPTDREGERGRPRSPAAAEARQLEDALQYSAGQGAHATVRANEALRLAAKEGRGAVTGVRSPLKRGSLLSRITQTGEVVLIPDTYKNDVLGNGDADFTSISSLCAGMRSIMLIPIRNDHYMGVSALGELVPAIPQTPDGKAPPPLMQAPMASSSPYSPTEARSPTNATVASGSSHSAAAAGGSGGAGSAIGGVSSRKSHNRHISSSSSSSSSAAPSAPQYGPVKGVVFTPPLGTFTSPSDKVTPGTTTTYRCQECQRLQCASRQLLLLSLFSSPLLCCCDLLFLFLPAPPSLLPYPRHSRICARGRRARVRCEHCAFRIYGDGLRARVRGGSHRTCTRLARLLLQTGTARCTDRHREYCSYGCLCLYRVSSTLSVVTLLQWIILSFLSPWTSRMPTTCWLSAVCS